jgi:NADPH:quinone reductase-like Zn-dependent oxidoreductase
MAVGAGARVIATAAPRDFDRCRSIGADQVFDYHDPELAGHLRGAAPAGVDLHLDTSGTNDLEQATGLLAPRGRIVLLAGARSRPILPAGELYMKDGAIRGFVISRAQPAELADAATSINRLLGAGLLRPRAVDVEPLSAAAGVHRRLEEGALRGRRTVLQP